MMTLVFGTVLPWLLIAVGTWLGYQLVRQNGRILLRLESIERQLGARPPAQRREAGRPAGRHGRAGLRAAGPHGSAPQALRVPWPGRVADLLQPEVRVLHEDGRRPGRPAARSGRRPGHAARGHHGRSGGEPAARRASRHSVRGPPPGADGGRLAVPRPGDADGLPDRRRGTHRQRIDRRRRTAAATGGAVRPARAGRVATATHRTAGTAWPRRTASSPIPRWPAVG